MGGGSYSYLAAESRACDYRAKSLHNSSYMDTQVFTKRKLDEAMDIRGQVRESRDSEEHPESFPIIIGLDVTGSMGYIPKDLIKNGFPKVMKKIMDEGVEHAQVCFMGIGDAECDEAPIQVGQFESSDELCEKWLKSIYLEGGGGGNPGESYSLAWYVAARNTSIDSFEKRGIKGVLITIGDEPNLSTMRRSDLKECIGNEQSDIESASILAEAREKWDVYHINIKDWAGGRKSTQDSWGQLMGDHFINTQSDKGDDIPDLISGIVLKCYNDSKTRKSVIVEDTTEHADNATESKPKSKTAEELLDEINSMKNS